MKPKIAFFLCLSFLLNILASTEISAQLNLGLQIPKGKKKVVVPFHYSNGFIIVEVVVGGYFPLNFILDTGAEHTILAEKGIADVLGLEYEKTFELIGSDLDTRLKAFLSHTSLSISSLDSDNEALLVLEENIFDFASFTGKEIFGIIGAKTFRNFTLQIDYSKGKLIFIQDKNFEPNLKQFTEIPIELHHSKPFLMANYSTSVGKSEMIKLLVDTGANIPILIQRDSNTISKFDGKLIPGIIAVGLGGDLLGFIGKTSFLGFEDFGFSGILTKYQVIDSSQNLSFMNERNGVIGNPLLSKFNIILDYVQERMYISPNKSYKKRFKFDRSGLVMITAGKKLNKFVVYEVYPDTPAFVAGLKPKDQVIGINGIPATFYEIQDILSKFQKREGKKLRLKILRNGEKQKISFRLRDLL